MNIQEILCDSFSYALTLASFCIFIQQRVENITLFVGRDEDSLKEVDQVHV